MGMIDHVTATASVKQVYLWRSCSEPSMGMERHLAAAATRGMRAKFDYSPRTILAAWLVQAPRLF